MAKTAPNIKSRIPSNETVFYLFKLSASDYLLYDSSMGDPLVNGSLNLVSSKLDAHKKSLNKNITDISKQKNIYVYKLMRDPTKGWKIDENMNGIYYNSPKSKPKTINHTVPKSPLKDIGYEKIYFWMDTGTVHYLYDIDMGSPIYYGNANKIKGTILVHQRKHNFSVILFYLPPKSDKPTYKMSIKYNVSDESTKKNLKEKKKTDDLNPEPPEKDKTQD